MIRTGFFLLGTAWRATLGTILVVCVLFVAASQVALVLLAILVFSLRPVRALAKRYPIHATTIVVAFVALLTGGLLSLGVLVGIAAVLLAIPDTRRWIFARYKLYGARRSWAAAAHWTKLSEEATPTRPARPAPRLLAIGESATGRRLDIRLHSGVTAADLERAAPGLASYYGRPVTVKQDARRPALASLLIHDRDPLARLAGIRWPSYGLVRLSMWEPIPVAVSADGDPVTITLPERNLLLAGEPGAGKSVIQSMVVATAALDPYCTLFMLDGKHVDLVMWEPCCQAFAGANMSDALAVLDAAHAWMAAAYDRLRTQGKRKISRDDPTALVVVDELAYYSNAGGKKQAKQAAEFNGKLRDLVARGRAAGMIVVAATQKPAADTIPSSLRDLIAYRWALRCTTPDASDTALGRGWAGRGYDAATIPVEQRGTGYLLAEGALPILCRGFMLTDPQVDELAVRAAKVRGAAVAAERPVVSAGEAGSSEAAGPVTTPASPPGRDRSAELRERIEQAARADPSASNRRIAALVGCDKNTVAKYRPRAGL